MTYVLWMVLGAVLALAAIYAYTRWRGRRKKVTPESLWKKLSRLTRDAAVARRLFSKERERAPNLSDIAILERVIRRLERDKRR